MFGYQLLFGCVIQVDIRSAFFSKRLRSRLRHHKLYWKQFCGRKRNSMQLFIILKELRWNSQMSIDFGADRSLKMYPYHKNKNFRLLGNRMGFLANAFLGRKLQPAGSDLSEISHFDVSPFEGAVPSISGRFSNWFLNLFDVWHCRTGHTFYKLTSDFWRKHPNPLTLNGN